MSDNLDYPEGWPVTKADSVSLFPRFPVQDDSQLYTRPDIFNYGTNGPFEQTLFLGCSVVNFNVNLGWGSENSTLTVSLINDTSYHPSDPLAQYNTNLIRQDNTVPRTADRRPFFPTIGPNQSAINTIMNNFVPGHIGPTGTLGIGTINGFNINKSTDFFKTIYIKEVEKENKRNLENIYLQNSNPPRPDFGKVYYKLLDNGLYIKDYWTKPDPGFVGETVDILGTAVRFIFNGFEFTGLISSWRNNGGQGGANQYTVEIKSFASLLSNTQLIIDHYAGTIFNKFEQLPPIAGLEGLTSFGVPSNDVGNRRGKYNSADASTSSYDINKYIGKVTEGNLPNVFNIYGYLEATNGFGKNNVNELGTKIKDIYSGIQDLITYTKTEDVVSEGAIRFVQDPNSYYKIGIVDARFSPYGRIVGKAPAFTKKRELSPNIEAGTYNVAYLKDQYLIIQPAAVEVFAIGTRNIENATTPPFQEQYLYNVNDAWNPPRRILYSHMGLIPTQLSSDGRFRQHYSLDLSELPQFNEQERISGPVISISDFVSHICEQANYDWFVDFNPINNQIKIRTISRQQQPANNYIEHLLISSVNTNNVSSYDYGKEFNDSAMVRSAYIGAKQKRLLQISSNFLANKNNGLIFDPYDDDEGTLLLTDLTKIVNSVKIPNHFSIRNLNHPYYVEGLMNAASGTGAVVWEDYYRDNWQGATWGGGNCGLGNYLDPIKYEGVNLLSAGEKGGPDDIFRDLGYLMYTKDTYFLDQTESKVKIIDELKPKIALQSLEKSQIKLQTDSQPKQYYNYPLFDEFICPYFGLDVDGTARRVYYDPAMRQVQVLCSIGDLQNLLGFALTKAIKFGSSGVAASNWQDPWTNEEMPGLGSQPTSYNEPQPYNPNDPISGGVAVAATASQASSVEERNVSWNIEGREFYKYDAKFLITENEIRAAMGSFESWMQYVFNKDFTTDTGQILRKTLFAQSGSLVQSKSQDAETDRVNSGRDYPVNIVFNGTDVGIVSDTASESPNTSKSSMYKDKIKAVLDKAYGYVKDLGDTYYGKQYMVKVPGLSVSRDKPYTTGSRMSLYFGGEEFKVNEYEAGGQFYSNYKPATDGAWEEHGNIIDDTIVIGSIDSDFFREADGRFGAILGFNGSYEYLKDTIDEQLLENLYPSGGPAAQEALGAITAGIAILDPDDNILTNWRSKPPEASPGGETAGTLFQDNLNNTSRSNNYGPYTKTVVPTTTMIYAQASQPVTGTDIIPNEFYPSLVTSLGDQDYLYYEYGLRGNSNRMPSFAKNEDIIYTSNKRRIPNNLIYKVYAKATLEPEFVFINRLNSTDSVETKQLLSGGKELRAVMTLGSDVVCNPVHLCDKFLGHALNLDAALFKKEGASIPWLVRSAFPQIITEKLPGEIDYEAVMASIMTDPSYNLSEDQEGQEIPIAVAYGTINNGLLPFEGGFGLGGPLNVIKLATDHLFRSVNSSFTDVEEKALTMPIAPKAAIPGFAAVPLESQTAVYGPWTNHPYLIRKEIFTDKDLETDPVSLNESVENLVGGLKVQVAEELAPWQYGSMTALDAAVITKIQNDASYQLQIEQGSMDIPGAPIYNLGDFLVNVGGTAGGPIINSISANIDKGSISTKYSFRTFSRKFSMFNKESADRLSKLNKEAISRRKEIATRAATVTNNRARNIKRQNINNYSNTDYVNPPMSLSWRSASELLVGKNELTLRMPNRTKGENPHTTLGLVSGLIDLFDYDYSWGFRPKYKLNPKLGTYNTFSFPKIFGQTKIMDSREAPRLMEGDYENTSFMSIDGLLSPISFYPTENFKTYHITKYDRESCRYCLGVGSISYKSNIQGIASVIGATQIDDIKLSKMKNAPKSIPCPFCEPLAHKISGIITSTKSGRSDPPFVFTTGFDKNDASISGTRPGVVNIKTNAAIINYSTLNPVVMSHGEFSIFQNRQSGDYTTHSIKMVGMGTVPPNGPNDSLNQQMCGENRLYKSFLEYDQLYLDKVQELYNIPQEERTPTIQNILNSIGTDKPKPFANNSRFFGFRGPMMLHGWGYDTEGYPVPNASGDYLYLPSGTDSSSKIMLRQTATGVENGTVYDIYQTQKFIRTGDLPSGIKVPDDAIIVNYLSEDEQNRGYFTEPVKDHRFAKGWAQTPSRWPVGPIDLRWDEKSHVWTVPTTYRNVYILLEEDLIGQKIARGELINNDQTELARSPAALGYRKTVFVRDTFGLYAAPRTALIYCAYDPDSGYYEPISQNSFTTSGTIISSNTASMGALFKKDITFLKNNSQSVSQNANFVATFSNPLDISIDPGDIGLFTYLQDGWIVQSTRG